MFNYLSCLLTKPPLTFFLFTIYEVLYHLCTGGGPQGPSPFVSFSVVLPGEQWPIAQVLRSANVLSPGNLFMISPGRIISPAKMSFKNTSKRTFLLI